ncbi:MAG: lactonase family protein [Scytonema sp. RU_4_4]|nr:lactonase family protein [Scytonema sp. RU_4_4]NJR73352.1 lactonase family protein [Scytonema sp. CRU_2_7]
MSSKKRFGLRITRSAISRRLDAESYAYGTAVPNGHPQGTRIAFIIGFLTLILISTQLSNAQSLKQLPKFTGRYIAAISDGDFLASTYGDAKLPALGVSDHLSILTLPLNGKQETIAQINASNSVTGAPYALALSPDSQTAFVVETLKPIPVGATRREQLPPGNQLVAIDLSNPRRPVVCSRMAVAPKPETVHVHPNGDLLAISTQTPDKEIILIPFQDDQIGQPIEFSLRQLGIQPDSERFQNGLYVSQVQWHPSGHYLAVNLDYRDEIAFYEVNRSPEGNPQLIPWGSPVKVGKDPFTGQFTPDGRFYLSSNWGRNFGAQVKTLEQRIPETRGTVSVIQLAELNTPASQVQHRVVSTAIADLSPESLAISPDGSKVVTVNMRGTAFPMNSPRFTRQATLSLLTLDRTSGQLTKINDYPFEGILPESAAFDASGNFLVLAVYDYFTPKPEGGIEFWRVLQKPRPELQRTGYVVDVGRGVHQVLIAR